MDPEFYRRLAQRARDLAFRARTEVARHQLLMWADEFEARALEIENEPCEKPS